MTPKRNLQNQPACVIIILLLWQGHADATARRASHETRLVICIVATTCVSSTNGKELSRPTSTSTRFWFVGCFNVLCKLYGQIHSYLPSKRTWEPRQYRRCAIRSEVRFRGFRDSRRQRRPCPRPTQGGIRLVRLRVCPLTGAHPFGLRCEAERLKRPSASLLQREGVHPYLGSFSRRPNRGSQAGEWGSRAHPEPSRRGPSATR